MTLSIEATSCIAGAFQAACVAAEADSPLRSVPLKVSTSSGDNGPAVFLKRSCTSISGLTGITRTCEGYLPPKAPGAISFAGSPFATNVPRRTPLSVLSKKSGELDLIASFICGKSLSGQPNTFRAAHSLKVWPLQWNMKPVFPESSLLLKMVAGGFVPGSSLGPCRMARVGTCACGAGATGLGAGTPAAFLAMPAVLLRLREGP
mmetsp:Transcript_35297/g.82404  ORF Transcript_35297/g.82404 Transcript_35297/m.82404 type:complete len:205 (-) Transcript_35297:1434-2048(-)